jgi:hypothetical protein
MPVKMVRESRNRKDGRRNNEKKSWEAMVCSAGTVHIIYRQPNGRSCRFVSDLPVRAGRQSVSVPIARKRVIALSFKRFHQDEHCSSDPPSVIQS